jgi:hypothetical protein
LVNITFPFALVIHSKNGEYLFMVNTKSNKTTKDIGEHMKKLLISGLVLASAMMSSLTYAPKVEAATVANWVECGNEGGECYFHNAADKIISMRYGNPGHYRYMWVRNRYNSKLECDNHAGDPNQGYDKKCQYSTYNFYSLPTSGSKWNNLCVEGEWCTAPPGTAIRWLRYGTNSKYFYQPVSPNQRFKCAHANLFGHKDPYKGRDKMCAVMKSSLDAERSLGNESDFIHCANEGSTCFLPSLRPTVVRYGGYNQSEGRYTYITAIVSDGALPCNNSMFRNDPISSNKTCEYMPIEYKTNSTVSAVGQWDAVGDNEASGAKKITFGVKTGVVKTDTDSTTEEWSKSITAGVEVGGLKVGVAEVTVSTSLTKAFAASSSLSSALALSVQETTELSCESDTIGFLKMWRFKTDIGFDNCLSEGICSFSVLPLSTICTDEDVIPQCMPGQCVPDTNCQQCFQN